jgi:hypothetical protein
MMETPQYSLWSTPIAQALVWNVPVLHANMWPQAMSQLSLIFYGHTIPGKPPLYLAVYVNDSINFSPDETVKRHFEMTMQAQLRVDFFGTFKWFLGTYYDGFHEESRASVHLSQEAHSRQLVSAHQMSNATPVGTPYHSGHAI